MKSWPNHPQKRTNYGRRTVGIVFCLSPVVLLLGSGLRGFLGPSREVWGISAVFGFALALIGLWFGMLNAYLSWVRPTLHVWRQSSMDGFRNISGLPLVGTLFAVVAAIIDFGGLSSTLTGLATLVLDTGGLPWFLISTWQDRSLWDN